MEWRDNIDSDDYDRQMYFLFTLVTARDEREAVCMLRPLMAARSRARMREKCKEWNLYNVNTSVG